MEVEIGQRPINEHSVEDFMPSVQHQHLNSYFCYGPSD